MNRPANSGAMSRPRLDVFVSFDHKIDTGWFDLLQKKALPELGFRSDTSIERLIYSDMTKQVCELVLPNEIDDCKIALVLVGKESWRRKYIDWEVDICLRLGCSVIGLHLPTLPVINDSISMPGRLLDNVRSGFATWMTFEALISSTDQYGILSEIVRNANHSLVRNNRSRLSEDIS
jgi:hypothetical protein